MFSNRRTKTYPGQKGEDFAFPANAAQFSSTECEEAFEGLPNMEDVVCSQGAVSAEGGAIYQIGETTRPRISRQLVFWG